MFTVDPQGRRLTLQLRAESKFLHRPDNQGSFTATRQISGAGPQEVVLRREDFNGPDGKPLDWSKIETFQVTLIDVEAKQPLALASGKDRSFLQSIQLVP